MAEICCGMMSDSESSPPYEPISRAARRRRMEIRRFKFVAGVAPQETAENEQKRRKFEFYAASLPGSECDNAVQDSGSDEEKRVTVKVGSESCKEIQNLCSSSSIPESTSMSEIPIPATRDPASSREYLRFGVASLCGRRRDMEDAVALHPSFFRSDDEDTAQFHYFAVYDGHGCSHVATKCRERLHEIVKEEMESKEEPRGGGEWKSVMERSFCRMDKEVVAVNEGATAVGNCRCELQSPECDAVGSTAVVAVVSPDKIIVANCGDSRAVLCRDGKAIPLSSDHKPDRPDELKRIESVGGRVIYWEGARVLGVLAMSRAIGDNYLKPYVSCEPEITITDRTAEDECLIIASDGLWDVVSNEMACGVARMCLRGRGNSDALSATGSDVSGIEISDKVCNNASMLLTKLALARHSSDNVSVAVVDLRKDNVA